MTDPLLCWHCGADISGLPQPLGRRAECLSCHAELHVCRMCRHYDPGKAKQCREPMAEEVKDKTRANFCEWFQAKANAFDRNASNSDSSRSQLEALFGGPDSSMKKDDPKSELDRLFGD